MISVRNTLGFNVPETTRLVLDTAKDIYRNATMEKFDLLQMLIVRERSTAEQSSKLNENLEVGLAAHT